MINETRLLTSEMKLKNRSGLFTAGTTDIFLCHLDPSTTLMEPSEAVVTANLRFWINNQTNLWNDNE